MKQRLEFYQAIYAKVGQQLPDPKAPVFSLKKDDKDKKKVKVRLQGIIDDMFGFSATDAIKMLDEEEPFDKIELTVDSVGGNAFQGLSLYSDLRARADKGVEISAESGALVASAATLPFLAADERTVRDESQFMIHNPQGFFMYAGGSADFKAEADKWYNALTAIEANVKGIYQKRMSADEATVSGWMENEKWFSSKEAKESGFVPKDDDSGEQSEMNSDVDKYRMAMLFSFYNQLKSE